MKSTSTSASNCLLSILSLSIFCIFLVYVCCESSIPDTPEKSDAIVLFIGPEDKERLDEVVSLMQEGFSDTLLVPGRQQVITAGMINAIQISDNADGIRRSYPNYYQNTHIEILEAKKMMNRMGIRSAIFVSAPYHIKRIRIISDTAFDVKTRQLYFVKSRFIGEPSSYQWVFIKQSISEYAKIIHFYLYYYTGMIEQSIVSG
ncbi:MAG: ElyC/SanA/YdcF family protein [Pseudomonadota bacterium]